MKLTTKLVEKVGADKLLHFLFEAWLVALSGVFMNFMITMIVFIAVSVLALVKELFLDKNGDTIDLVFSMFGGIVSMVILSYCGAF